MFPTLWTRRMSNVYITLTIILFSLPALSVANEAEGEGISIVGDFPWEVTSGPELFVSWQWRQLRSPEKLDNFSDS